MGAERANCPVLSAGRHVLQCQWVYLGRLAAVINIQAVPSIFGYLYLELHAVTGAVEMAYLCAVGTRQVAAAVFGVSLGAPNQCGILCLIGLLPILCILPDRRIIRACRRRNYCKISVHQLGVRHGEHQVISCKCHISLKYYRCFIRKSMMPSKLCAVNLHMGIGGILEGLGGTDIFNAHGLFSSLPTKKAVNGLSAVVRAGQAIEPAVRARAFYIFKRQRHLAASHLGVPPVDPPGPIRLVVVCCQLIHGICQPPIRQGCIGVLLIEDGQPVHQCARVPHVVEVHGLIDEKNRLDA